jgi:dihydroorotate dehydrogenase electron transfer subunit
MNMQAQQGQACVAHTTLCTPDTVHMVLDAPWLQWALPGQFIMLRIQPDTDPLLRRPISLCAVTPTGIELLFKIRGIGTQRMAAWPEGHTIDIIGPLGNGFTPPPAHIPAWLVAGGIGIAPLICDARWLLSNRPDCDVRMYLGAGTSADIDAYAPFIPEGCALHIATEDGTRGERGFVTDMLAADADSHPEAVLYGCGPMPMLNALATLARRTAQACQISLEAHMACGIGACLGCAVPAHSPDGPAYARVCADGPVFDAQRIFPPA